MTNDAVSAELAAIQLTDEHGTSHRLGDLWRDRPVVIAWVRHFGWMFCREHVVQLHHAVGAIHKTGAELVVIGSGTPNFVAGFREVTGFEGPILTDPKLVSYAAAKLRRGMWRNFTPLSMVHGARALARGNMQGRTQGDASQQGGVMVIVPPGRVVYTHTSHVAGDNAPPSEILEALQQQTAHASAVH